MFLARAAVASDLLETAGVSEGDSLFGVRASLPDSSRISNIPPVLVHDDFRFDASRKATSESWAILHDRVDPGWKKTTRTQCRAKAKMGLEYIELTLDPLRMSLARTR